MTAERDPAVTGWEAADTTLAAARADHDNGTCSQSEWSCSFCEADENPSGWAAVTLAYEHATAELAAAQARLASVEDDWAEALARVGEAVKAQARARWAVVDAMRDGSAS